MKCTAHRVLQSLLLFAEKHTSLQSSGILACRLCSLLLVIYFCTMHSIFASATQPCCFATFTTHFVTLTIQLLSDHGTILHHAHSIFAAVIHQPCLTAIPTSFNIDENSRCSFSRSLVLQQLLLRSFDLCCSVRWCSLLCSSP